MPQVEVARDAKPRRKRVGVKCKKSDAPVIKTEQSKYSDVLKAMRSDAKLVHLGADVRSFRRTRTIEMILELKRDKERNGAAYRSPGGRRRRLATEVAGRDTGSFSSAICGGRKKVR